MSLLKPHNRRPRNTANYDESGYRRANLRGDIDLALAGEHGNRKAVKEGPAEATRLDRIAPETPRPTEMLEHVEVKGDDDLTVGDERLHELLVGFAYQRSKRIMQEGREYAIPTANVLRFLGEGSRRKGLRETLARLASTTVSFGVKGEKGVRHFEGVPLLAAWLESEGGDDDVRYVVPSPICKLMASQPRYGYLELAALAKMKSRYGVRLYRHLALEMSLLKHRRELSNEYDVTVTVDQLRRWLGFPGDHVGQLRTRGLGPALADLAHVRRFSLVKSDPVKSGRRGGGIDGWRLVLKLNPPGPFEGRMQGVSKELRAIVGGVDAPKFRVRQDVWQRLGQTARDNGLAAGFHDAFTAWLLAVDEALTGVPVTDGYATREFRGERLLKRIDAVGPERAASELLAEEIAEADLLARPEDEDERRARFYREREARKARYHRWKNHKATKKEKRERAEREARKAAADAEAVAEAVVEAPVLPAVSVLQVEAVALAPGRRAIGLLLRSDATEEEAMQVVDDILGGSWDEANAPVLVDVFASCIGDYRLGELPLSDADIGRIEQRHRDVIERLNVGTWQ